MKKIVQLLAGTVMSAGLMAGVAAAQSIGTTGPGSTNLINNTQTSTTTQTCTNNVNTTNTNTQGASSGTSTSSGNTVGGGAQSGTATNSNSTSTNVNLDGCGNCTTCGQTPGGTTPGSSQQGGQGGGSVAGATTTAAAAGVVALPSTGAGDVIKPMAMSLLALGGLAAAAQLVVSGYRRLALR